MQSIHYDEFTSDLKRYLDEAAAGNEVMILMSNNRGVRLSPVAPMFGALAQCATTAESEDSAALDAEIAGLFSDSPAFPHEDDER